MEEAALGMEHGGYGNGGDQWRETGKRKGGAGCREGERVDPTPEGVVEMEAVEVLVEKVAEVACFGDSNSS